ncbi:hypothetical protein [Bradyrhizobium ivorense]|nr:hypothetical protein [Bradyrhizobium ivorense]
MVVMLGQTPSNNFVSENGKWGTGQACRFSQIGTEPSSDFMH